MVHPRETRGLFQKSARRELIGSGRQVPRERIDAYASLLTPVGSRLLYERLNVRMSRVRVQNTPFLADKPVMIVTGSDDLEHIHAP
jgi:hypothetical protein